MKAYKEAQPVRVTMPSLAPQEEFQAVLRQAWETGILTHNGPLVQRLERELRDRFAVSHVVAVTNGTLALQLAIRALGLKGEIITTPFSWIATCSAITWEGCQPVFCDIDPGSFNMDPLLIEERITDRTTGIMPVHVFSAPCDNERIEEIARRRGLKVIYDAAHASFVRYQGTSVLAWGDISAASFHATKIFNTGEGGACVTGDPALAERLKRLRFFGHDDRKEIVDEGLNAKMTEVHAALGLANMPHMDEVLTLRRRKYTLYLELLRDEPRLRFQRFHPESYNYSYMPVVFETEALLLQVDERLRAHNVFPRRYFHPSLSRVLTLQPSPPMPRSEDLAARILCLPLYTTLREEQIENVCRIVKST